MIATARAFSCLLTEITWLLLVSQRHQWSWCWDWNSTAVAENCWYCDQPLLRNVDNDLQVRQSGYYACVQHHIAFVQPCLYARLSILTALRTTGHQIYACVSSPLKNPAVAAHQLPIPLALPETYSKVDYCTNEVQTGCNGRLNNSTASTNCG